jgi:hypothetical protein
LLDELLVYNAVALWSNSLLDPCEKDGDDDNRLETLSEADEEDCELRELPALLGVR